ncbi:hypothetical protein [Paenibacillus pinisoli]|uniref:hypothetical protein n=1 Tax=Paenibacillus pinisoli TaxID=1276110 RepID=UPI001403F0B4|nr:hypothetical protein [Paenibacillus pinisoli]
MLKDTIRQLVSSTEKMSLALGGQPQFAGVSAAEHKALLNEMNNKHEKNGYAFIWN